MQDDYKLYISELIKGKHQGILPSLIRGGLHAGSLGFKLGAKIRNWAYDQQFLSQYSLPVPLVISIGNIVAGGTGKTPLTLLLAKELSQHAQIAILSRGYKSSAEHLPLPVILCNREGPIYPASYCGDEPYLLANNLPESIIIVGKDRRTSALIASRAGAKIILLDDGMQYRSLNRDLEIVIINSTDPFGQGFHLPRGFLRESLSSLSRAHFIILNHVTDHSHYLEMEKQIRQYTDAPTVGTQLCLKQIHTASGQILSSIRNVPVGVFCGIAHPEHFEKTLLNLGANIVNKKFCPDHIGFDKEQLINFSHNSHAAGAKLLICTEKDFVKLPQDCTLPCEIAWLQTELSLFAGQEAWNDLITKCKTAVINR